MPNESTITTTYSDEHPITYNKTSWNNGDIITANKLNNIEQGIDRIKIAYIKNPRQDEPRDTLPEGMPILPDGYSWYIDRDSSVNGGYYKLYYNPECTQEYTYEDYINSNIIFIKLSCENNDDTLGLTEKVIFLSSAKIRLNIKTDKTDPNISSIQVIYNLEGENSIQWGFIAESNLEYPNN